MSVEKRRGLPRERGKGKWVYALGPLKPKAPRLSDSLSLARGQGKRGGGGGPTLHCSLAAQVHQLGAKGAGQTRPRPASETVFTREQAYNRLQTGIGAAPPLRSMGQALIRRTQPEVHQFGWASAAGRAGGRRGVRCVNPAVFGRRQDKHWTESPSCWRLSGAASSSKGLHGRSLYVPDNGRVHYLSDSHSDQSE
jgi:hypothetical protein